MFILSVTPIKKGFGLETLSYFSPEFVEAGSIISVPLRKGSSKALVVDCSPAEDSKAEIRSASFSLRKIEKLESEPFISSLWMSAVSKTCYYFASNYGSTISSLIPVLVLKNLEFLMQKNFVSESSNNFNFLAFQGNDEERFSHYKSIIREEFAKGKSVFICFSNIEETEEAKQIFSKGIEKYILTFNSKLSKDKLVEQWNIIQESKHPLLIIASAQWLFLPVQNLGLVIVDREQKSGWKSMSRPFIDMRKFAEVFAMELGIKFVVGDLSLSSETVWQYKEHDPYKFETLNFRANSGAKSLIVDMKKKAEEGSEVLLISKQLIRLVEEAKEDSKNIFIYASRKGLSSMTVCRDCGTEVVCDNCSSPVVLYKGKNGNIFRCHQCGEMRSAQEVCKNCNSWRLLPLGVGVERVAEELKKIVSEDHIFEVNKEATPTIAKAKKVVANFYNTLGGVLIGTEMVLPLLKENVDFSAIASIDSLFAIPDYHVRERIFHIILEIKGITNEKFLIQTRNAEQETVEMALGGNILEFYKREIKEREDLQYPPFSIFIKVTCRGQKAFVKKEMEKINYIFKSYNPAIFPSTSERQGTPYAENAVIKIPLRQGSAGQVKKDLWPNSELLFLLRSLPPFFEIKVDPDNLL